MAYNLDVNLYECVPSCQAQKYHISILCGLFSKMTLLTHIYTHLTVHSCQISKVNCTPSND